MKSNTQVWERQPIGYDNKIVTYARYKGTNGEAGFKSGKVYKIEKFTFYKHRSFIARLLGKKPEVAAIHTYKAVKGITVATRAVLSTKMVFLSEEKYQFTWHEEHNGYFDNLKKTL